METPFPKGEYDGCTFVDCKFEGVDMANMTFLECTFTDCDLTNAMLKSTVFNEVTFDTCKLLGTNFSHCNDFMFAATFVNCNLKLASFSGLSIKGTDFKASNLEAVDFTETNLANASFDACNLKAAIFEHTDLQKADFSTATHYEIDPEINKLKQAIFSKEQLHGLLKKYDIKII